MKLFSHIEDAGCLKVNCLDAGVSQCAATIRHVCREALNVRMYINDIHTKILEVEN